MFKRLKNIWRLSALEQREAIDRTVKLEAPRETKAKRKNKLAVIVELDPPDMFPKEETIEL